MAKKDKAVPVSGSSMNSDGITRVTKKGDATTVWFTPFHPPPFDKKAWGLDKKAPKK